MEKNRKKKYFKITSLALLCLFVLSLTSYAFYTNTNKYFVDSRKDDGLGMGSLGLERDSTDFIEDGCGTGTMLDTLTGLCWLKDMNTFGNNRNWATALTDCSGLDYAGNSDWVLPSKNELGTLIDQIGGTGSTCATLATFNFINCQSAMAYWSKNEYIPATSNAWLVNFNDGSGEFLNKVNIRSVVCVRRDY